MKEDYTQPWMKLYNEQMQLRLEKAQQMKKDGLEPYKNGYKSNAQADTLLENFSKLSAEELEKHSQTYQMVGRVMIVRSFGKAAFLKFNDGTAAFQAYVKTQDLDEVSQKEYKLLDHGDIIYIKGNLFKTKKGELTLNSHEFKILTKALRPLPEKFHGLTDPELCYRMRYLDLIMNSESKQALKLRSLIIREIRHFFYQEDYLEVETPMLHSIPGGATARPFNTHHNALDMELFLRIAPELHLKRLIVGGFPKVFEIGRCFRNEGLSIKHNPEFTSVEYYQAYATYEDQLALTEKLIKTVVKNVLGKESVQYGEREINFEQPFKRLTMHQALREYAGFSSDNLADQSFLQEKLTQKGIEQGKLKGLTVAELINLCFEELVEEQLIQPTFITHHPTVISPLARKNEDNPEVVDRFELFINGWELANAFSELNDPLDQLERFAEQAVLKDQGNLEASDVDYDYVRALEFGMPPTAGAGLGIDRLCILLTKSSSIRDVICFPLLKKESFFHQE